MASPAAASTPASAARELLRAHPIALVGGTWGSVLGLTLAFLWSRRMPLQLKVIQGRIVAQGALLGGLALVAAASFAYDPPRLTAAERSASTDARMRGTQRFAAEADAAALPAVADVAAAAGAAAAHLK